MAAVDAGKCFQNFLTRPDERPFLGCIHSPRVMVCCQCQSLMNLICSSNMALSCSWTQKHVLLLESFRELAIFQLFLHVFSFLDSNQGPQSQVSSPLPLSHPSRGNLKSCPNENHVIETCVEGSEGLTSSGQAAHGLKQMV